MKISKLFQKFDFIKEYIMFKADEEKMLKIILNSEKTVKVF